MALMSSMLSSMVPCGQGSPQDRVLGSRVGEHVEPAMATATSAVSESQYGQSCYHVVAHSECSGEHHTDWRARWWTKLCTAHSCVELFKQVLQVIKRHAQQAHMCWYNVMDEYHGIDKFYALSPQTRLGIMSWVCFARSSQLQTQSQSHLFPHREGVDNLCLTSVGERKKA